MSSRPRMFSLRCRDGTPLDGSIVCIEHLPDRPDPYHFPPLHQELWNGMYYSEITGPEGLRCAICGVVSLPVVDTEL